MLQTYTAVIQQDEGWWIGWIQEIPGVNGQERTKDELLEALQITLTAIGGYSSGLHISWDVRARNDRIQS